MDATTTTTIGPYTYGPDVYGTYQYGRDGKVYGDGIATPGQARQACIDDVEYDGSCPRCFEETGGQDFNSTTSVDPWTLERVSARCEACGWAE